MFNQSVAASDSCRLRRTDQRVLMAVDVLGRFSGDYVKQLAIGYDGECGLVELASDRGSVCFSSALSDLYAV